MNDLKNIVFTGFLAFLLGLGTLNAQIGERYASQVFDEVTTLSEIPFSSAVRIGDDSPTTLYFDFYEPTGDTLTARPLVITVFGGAFVAGSRDYIDMVTYCTRLAEHGYAAASIDYRLLSFFSISAQNLVRDAYMAAQDVSSAIRFFKANSAEYRIDTNNIFLLGNSAGSIASLHAMFMTEEERPAETFESPDLGGIHSSGFAEYAGFSPRVSGGVIHWGGVMDTTVIDSAEYVSICMIHGTEDATVPYDSGYCFSSLASFVMPFMYGSHPIANYLSSIGIEDYEFHPFEGEEHCFYLNTFYQLIDEKFDTCFNITRNFLYNHLQFPDPSSIEDHSSNNNISLYPNPVSRSFTLSTDKLDNGQTYHIEIMNSLGQVVKSESRDFSNPVFNVSDLSSGVYYISINQKDNFFTGKFIKK